jgi:hypothetical protein
LLCQQLPPKPYRLEVTELVAVRLSQLLTDAVLTGIVTRVGYVAANTSWAIITEKDPCTAYAGA